MQYNDDVEEKNRIYAAIDLKSFYASVECVERGLDPLNTNLVVADESRTEKTICLAVSPSLKAYGISGRARLFEVVQQVRKINSRRQRIINGNQFRGSSYDDRKLKEDPWLKLDYVTAEPRMAFYIQYSTKVYDTYLKYVSPEDIHVYSIDEVFIDLTDYLNTYQMSARALVMKMIRDVLQTTGITAAAGIGTNLYLAKVAMDIVAKHIPADENGVRIAELDETEYRKQLWTHRPLRDFWRVGRGYAAKLEANGLYTMGDIARCSIGGDMDYLNEDLLYRLFGVNAELLIDHAWGYEPCTIRDIKAYRPENNSISTAQVLQSPYTYDTAKIVVKEMCEAVSLDLTEKRLITDQIVLGIGYDSSCLDEEDSPYSGEVTKDWYGKSVPKPAHGSVKLERQTSSTRMITEAVMKLYQKIVNDRLLIRRIHITAANVIPEDQAREKTFEVLDLFSDYDAVRREEDLKEEELEKDKRIQQALVQIKKKYGKNAVLKGMDLEKGATAKDRNKQIGGHKA